MSRDCNGNVYNVGPARTIDEKLPSRFRVIKFGLGLPGMTLLAVV
jgi:hypothetical protein